MTAGIPSPFPVIDAPRAPLFRRIFATALLAGLIAGLFAAGAQRVKLVPLIEQAEIYEAAGHDHDGAAWEPSPGLERMAYTVLADVLTGIGFALILTGAIAVAGLAGHAVDARRGLLWGAAGFAAFTLAPSLGLPPLPPGAEAAELAARQTWWVAAALATAVGLGLIVFWRPFIVKAAGAAILLLPHLIGAPHAEHPGGTVPGDIAAQFAIASIATAALFWLLLGAVTGWLFRRLG